MSKNIFFIIVSFMFSSAFAQEQLTLYPNEVLNSKDGVSLGDNSPEFYFYKPESQKSNKVFLIIPGGGYGRVAINHEGHDVANRLKDMGYASFVLKYRLPVDSQMIDKKLGPIQDAQTAMVYIHDNHNRLNIDMGKIVVLGFSAGGHLASTVATHFDTSYIGDIDIKKLKPDYSVLVYPVITMQEGITHLGSKKNLIGPDFLEQDVVRFSNERNVNKDTPPTYLIHSDDDKVVPIENALMYKRALDKYAVQNKFYRYAKGVHGFGMYNKDEEGDWFVDMLEWVNYN